MSIVDSDSLERKMERVRAEHIRAFRVTATLWKVIQVSSRQYKHPHSDPRRRFGLKHTKRKWHFVTCVRLSDGHIQISCNGPHCVFVRDGHGSTVCKHSIAVCLHLMKHPSRLADIQECLTKRAQANDEAKGMASVQLTRLVGSDRLPVNE